MKTTTGQHLAPVASFKNDRAEHAAQAYGLTNARLGRHVACAAVDEDDQGRSVCTKGTDHDEHHTFKAVA